jgi:hypothetical protein
MAGIVFSYLLLFKLQSFFWTPLLILYLKIRSVIFLFTIFIFVFLISFPFANKPYYDFIIDRFVNTVGQYPFASLNAYNFWTLLFLQSKSDQLTFLTVKVQIWGIVICSIIFVAILWKYFEIKKIFNDEKSLVFTSALVLGAAFLFLTRAHERHILPFVALLTIFVPFFNKKGTSAYLALSLTSVLNLVNSYAWMEWKLLIMHNFLPFILSLINLVSFFSLLF